MASWDRIHNNPMPNESGLAHEESKYEYSYYNPDMVDDSLINTDCEELIIKDHNFDNPDYTIVPSEDEDLYNNSTIPLDLTKYTSFTIGVRSSATYCNEMECRVQVDVPDYFSPGKIFWHDDDPSNVQTTHSAGDVPDDSIIHRYIPDRMVQYDVYITLEATTCVATETGYTTETSTKTYYYHFRNDWDRTRKDLLNNIMPKQKR